MHNWIHCEHSGNKNFCARRCFIKYLSICVSISVRSERININITFFFSWSRCLLHINVDSKETNSAPKAGMSQWFILGRFRGFCHFKSRRGKSIIPRSFENAFRFCFSGEFLASDNRTTRKWIKNYSDTEKLFHFAFLYGNADTWAVRSHSLAVSVQFSTFAS